MDGEDEPVLVEDDEDDPEVEIAKLEAIKKDLVAIGGMQGAVAELQATIGAQERRKKKHIANPKKLFED
eukprot:13100590-Alexandrium_andersonii.AAC.1